MSEFKPTDVDLAQRAFYDGLLAANRVYMDAMQVLMIDHAEAMQKARDKEDD